MTSKDFYGIVTALMTNAVSISFGDFDIYCDAGNGVTIMITHQLNGDQWENCVDDKNEWDTKRILVFHRNSEPVELASYKEED